MASPLLLHPKSYLLRLILLHIHVAKSHAGINYSVAEFRQHYFVPRAQKLLPSIIRKDCIQCKRAIAKPLANPTHASKPNFRLYAFSHPFTYTGVDIFGPFMVFDHYKERAKKSLATPTTRPYKKWVLIFTCLSTRAVYLFSVSSLATEELWMAFTTFFEDRTTPEVMLSDNAAQFHLIATYLIFGRHL